MAPVTNDVLLNAILELKGDVGTLLANVESQKTNLANHIQDDLTMASDIAVLKTAAAERKGATRVMHAVSGGLGGIAGAALTAWFRNHT